MLFCYCFIVAVYVIDHGKCSSIANRYPTRGDMIEASFLSGHITDSMLRYIVEQQLLYCPLEPFCNNLRRSFLYGNYSTCCGLHSWNREADVGEECSDYNNTLSDRNVLSCIAPQYAPYGKTKLILNAGVGYVMVSKCAADYRDQNILSKCNLNSETVDVYDLSLFIPVSTANNDTVYKNRYCAICNYVSKDEVVDWKTQVLCSEGVPFFKPPTTQYELLQQIHGSNHCNILFFSTGKHIKKCKLIPYTSCNQTGKWKHYDAIIEQGCNSYTSVYIKKYKNVFCYMCNTDKPPIMGCTEEDFTDSGGGLFGTFTGLIRYRTHQSTTSVDEQCSSDEEVYDSYKGRCRRVYCPAFYYYDKLNSSCHSIFDTVSNIIYEVYYKINIPDHLHCSFCYELLYNVKEELIKKLTSQLFYLKPCTTQNPLWYQSRFNDSSHAEYLVVKFSFAVLLSHDYNIYVQRFTTLSEVNITYNNQNESISVELQSLMKFESDKSLTPFPYLPSHVADSSECLLFDLLTIHVVQYYFYPRILLTVDELSTLNTKVKILDYIEYNINSVIGNSSHVLVDVNHYMMMIHENNNSIKHTVDQDGDVIEDILSATCSLISIICLIMTLTVYFLFKELQSKPGINNMILSFNLILAHALYMFGLNATQYENICVILGLSIHFFWISSIMWMHVCSIHMFRVFYFMNNRHHERPSNQTICRYSFYVLIVSCLCVCINIIFYFINSEDDVGYLGYGGSHCYITKPYMVLFTFALPIGLILLSNLVLFLMVVFRIGRLPKVNSSHKRVNQNRNTFVIYAKLTCLTGVTWIFGFIYQWTLIKAFSYIFIVLNASQGLFIFLSFGCNNRVRKMCILAIKRNESSQSSSASGMSDVINTKL